MKDLEKTAARVSAKIAEMISKRMPDFDIAFVVTVDSTSGSSLMTWQWDSHAPEIGHERQCLYMVGLLKNCIERIESGSAMEHASVPAEVDGVKH